MDRYYEHRGRAIELLGGKCVDCGGVELLEFDHRVARDKAYNIGDKLGRVKFERLLTELAKCDLRCNPCHIKKTLQHGEGSPERTTTHGDLAMYTRYKCRCDVCRKVYSDWRRLHRARKGITKGIYKKPDHVKHGMVNMYWKGCRCAMCRRANADIAKERRKAGLAQSAEALR